LIATSLFVGVPPLSGFFSKVEILATAYQQSQLYSFSPESLPAPPFLHVSIGVRGVPWCSKSPLADHARESPGVMTVPLVAGGASLLAGFGELTSSLEERFQGQRVKPMQHRGMKQILAPFNHSPLAALFGLLPRSSGLAWRCDVKRQPRSCLSA
jgi:NADH:ubiquinone oxidoreductase subunit 5 (subunit L)/multisubunit Na+/H+ antiporter MnhA subunit